MTEDAGQHLNRGAVISRYEVLEILGSGGFGITYKVFDTRLHCEVAMKEYLPAELTVRGDDNTTVMPRSQDLAEEYRHGLTRFLDEARTLAKFKNRHIVRVSDYMELNGTAYLVMDYEDGRPLGDLIKQRGGPLSEIEIKDIFIPILDGLKTVHDAGLLHRDIKPDNIYLRKDGPPVLLDFGAARQYTAGQTRSVTTIVTPGYAPFEQYQVNGKLGAWTDLYALGATLYACISGRPPLDAITRHSGHQVDPLPPAVEVGRDKFSEVLLRTVDWMLRSSPGERPQSVDDVLPCIQGRAEPPQPAPPAATQSVAPTVRLSDSEAPAASTARSTEAAATVRMPDGPAPEADRATRPGGGLRTPVLAGTAAAILIGAGAAWWYLQDPGNEQQAIETAQEIEPVQGAEDQDAEDQVAEDQGAEDQGAEDLARAETEETAAMTSADEAPREPRTEDDPATQAASGSQADGETDAGQASAASIAEASDADEPPTAEPQQGDGPDAGAGRVAEDAEPASPASIAEAPDTDEPPTAEPRQGDGPDAGAERVTGDAEPASTASIAEAPDADEPPTAEPQQGDGPEAGAGRVAEDAEPASPASIAEAPDADEPPTAEPQQGGGPEAGADRVTEDVDEFLAALMTESSQSDADGDTAASTGQGAGAQQPTSGDVDRLLEQAEAYLAASSLVAPEGRNARTIYERVLAMDPGNPDALAGMNRIGAVYEKAAGIMIDEGRSAVSRQVVARGLDAVPDHPGLLRLQDKLAAQ